MKKSIESTSTNSQQLNPNGSLHRQPFNFYLIFYFVQIMNLVGDPISTKKTMMKRMKIMENNITKSVIIEYVLIYYPLFDILKKYSEQQSGHLNNVQSLSNLRLDESNTEKQRLSHSISLHSFNEIHQASSSKGSCLQLRYKNRKCFLCLITKN